MKSVRDSVPTSRFSPAPSSVPPFLSKTYDMVDDQSTNDVVSWSSGGNSFVVWNVPEFGKQLLPKYFKHNNFSSFVRQLNTYGFRKVDPDRWEFSNDGFLRGQRRLLEGIVRRKPSHVQSQQQSQAQSLSTGACLEVGKFGLEEEVERLKRDKNVLMQELVRLRQQQQTTENQLQTVGQKVQGMEQRQQQMMSFLAKAMRNPSFLNQLVQQQNENNRHIAGSNKKRRLPREDQDSSTDVHVARRPDGQIIKYQPSMNEAAKAMLRQILKMSTSPRREPISNNPGSLLIVDDPASYNTLDRGRSSSTVSEVTLSEAAANSGKLGQIPKTDVLQSQDHPVLPDLASVHGTDVADHDFDLLGSDVGNGDCDMDPISVVLEGSNALETDVISPENDMNGLLDGVSKTPAINDDSFWEQFLAASPVIGDPDEISLGPMGADFGHLATENESAIKNQHMYHLTEQMGLLSSSAQRN